MIKIYDDWTCDELERLTSLVKENGFKYEISDTVVEDIKSFAHPIQSRIENSEGIPNPQSHLYHFILKIIYRFCFDNDIDFDVVCRSVINYSHPAKDSHYPKHTDHPYDHKLLLFYLNDTDGDTIFHHGLEREIVSPQKGRVVVADGSVEHSTIAPQTKERIVLVATVA